MNSLTEQKQQIRTRVWNTLDTEGAVVGGTSCVGKIPNFHGAEHAAQRLVSLRQWERASIVKSNPDKAQRAVREYALQAGKTVYMAVPKIANIKPFYRLDNPTQPADADYAAHHASTVQLEDVEPIDIAICGSVAVNRQGVRLGKGAGYADLELALLTESGAITPNTLIVTTIHPQQLLDEEIPEAPHDFRANIIVTPDEIIHCPSSERPVGLMWEALDATTIAAIPILAARAQTQNLHSS